MIDWNALIYFAEFIIIIIIPALYLFYQQKMTSFPSPTQHGGQQCPPPPPSSPNISRRQSSNPHSQEQFDHSHPNHPPQQPPLPQQQIANLLQYAQTSYTTNPTDALSALMDALTLTTGTNAAAQHAMNRIRSELGDAVANSVAGNSSSITHQQQSSTESPEMTEREMTMRAMAVVQELLSDTSTILYAQGKQHLLQQAMEDGSSVVCTKCGDMISRERWTQHTQYWCRAIDEEMEED